MRSNGVSDEKVRKSAVVVLWCVCACVLGWKCVCVCLGWVVFCCFVVAWFCSVFLLVMRVFVLLVACVLGNIWLGVMTRFLDVLSRGVRRSSGVVSSVALGKTEAENMDRNSR